MRRGHQNGYKATQSPASLRQAPKSDTRPGIDAAAAPAIGPNAKEAPASPFQATQASALVGDGPRECQCKKGPRLNAAGGCHGFKVTEAPAGMWPRPQQSHCTKGPRPGRGRVPYASKATEGRAVMQRGPGNAFAKEAPPLRRRGPQWLHSDRGPCPNTARPPRQYRCKGGARPYAAGAPMPSKVRRPKP